MRQPIPVEKIVELMQFYVEKRHLFQNGKLNGKMETMMKAKCDELGLTMRTFWRHKKRLEAKPNGKG